MKFLCVGHKRDLVGGKIGSIIFCHRLSLLAWFVPQQDLLTTRAANMVLRRGGGFAVVWIIR
jgi:hypothetical protein